MCLASQFFTSIYQCGISSITGNRKNWTFRSLASMELLNSCFHKLDPHVENSYFCEKLRVVASYLFQHYFVLFYSLVVCSFINHALPWKDFRPNLFHILPVRSLPPPPLNGQIPLKNLKFFCWRSLGVISVQMIFFSLICSYCCLNLGRCPGLTSKFVLFGKQNIINQIVLLLLSLLLLLLLLPLGSLERGREKCK